MVTTNRNILFKGIVLALCIISLVHVFIFPLYDDGKKKSVSFKGKTYGDLEPKLCEKGMKKRKLWSLNNNCPSDFGIVTVIQGGRLGNQMWEYASVWAVARRTGLDPYIPRCMKILLDQFFESLSVPDFTEIAHCPTLPNNYVKSVNNWTADNKNIILRKYSTLDMALTWHEDIVQEFTFNKQLREKRDHVLLEISKKIPQEKEPIFVSVHVRRTDYIGYIKRKHHIAPPNLSFYIHAIEYFQNKYDSIRKQTVFVILSDDPKWCAQKFGHLKNVFIASKNNPPALDMAIMAGCNHSIYDYGTFGEWGAILAGGETIFYNLKHASSSRVAKMLNHWHPMTNTGIVDL